MPSRSQWSIACLLFSIVWLDSMGVVVGGICIVVVIVGDVCVAIEKLCPGINFMGSTKNSKNFSSGMLLFKHIFGLPYLAGRIQ